ncbi:hypothetical protein AB7M31_002473 [Pseudomonas sp. IAP-CY TE4608]
MLDPEKTVGFFQKEWSALSSAPSAFVLLTLLAAIIAYRVCKWRYEGIIETLKERLISRTEQMEKYKERAIKFDEKIEKVVDSSTIDLYENAMSLVGRIRGFIERRKRQSGINITTARMTDGEENPELSTYREQLMRTLEETTSEWNRSFKVEAMLIRDELQSRTRLEIDPSIEFTYEHPTNFHGYEAIATHLESMARRMKDFSSKA